MIKIAIAGAHGSKKTELVTKLEGELKRRGKTVGIVSKIAESSPFGCGSLTNFHSQRYIFHQQLLSELEGKYKDPDVLICDGSIIDNVSYTEYLLEQNKTFHMVEFLQMVEMARLWAKDYDYVIFTPLIQKNAGAEAKDIEKLIKETIQCFNVNMIKARKNFNVSTFLDRFTEKKKVRVINRKRK